LKFTKKAIEDALKTINVPGEGKNMIDSKSVKNIVVFEDEVIVDLVISNPSLQAKKRTEVNIMKAIHDLVYAKAKIQVNVKVEAP
jgi:ATP-binding protein involved in chromosome partitioning